MEHLPESLDETYLRVLSQIPKANQPHAHRILQCLVVAIRPLQVEELAELLSFKFDASQGEISGHYDDWRWEDQNQAVLSTCSSLVTIISDEHGRQFVQFSHPSVKEFLMSNRLGDFSRYHIHPLSAHTVLTRACLRVLIHWESHWDDAYDDHIDEESVKYCPLAEYAVRHWVEHARFGDVASRVQDEIETLLDPDKPHFKTWARIYNMVNM